MADEKLPEGTDTIIAGATGPSRAAPDADLAEDTAPADTAAGAGPADKPSETAATPDAGNPPDMKGAWFDRIDQLKTQGVDSVRAYAVSGKDKATGALDDLIRSVGDAAAQIDARVGTNYGDYARRAAESLGGFNDALKGKDVDDLFADARALVAKAPAVAVGTAAALGFVVARLARAGLPEQGAPTPSATRGED